MVEYYYTIFSFYLKERKLIGQLKTLYLIDDHYPLHFYIQNAISNDVHDVHDDIHDIVISKQYTENSNDFFQYHDKTYDLYIIDDHHRYYQYIYQQKRNIFYYHL